MRLSGAVAGGLVVLAQAAAAQFVHPGLFHTQEDLDRMKSMVASNVEPWASGYLVFSTNSFSQSTYGGSSFGFPTVGRNPDVNRTAMDQNSSAAYQLAVRWYITGNQAYANKAIQILDGWSGQLTNMTGTDRRLLASLAGTKLVNAAEILRHTNSGWTNSNQFGAMMRNVFYPVCKDFTGSGNWSTGSLKFILALAIFLDDETMFESAVNAFKFGAPYDCSVAVTNYIQAQGWNYETDRDRQHSQLGIAHLAEAAEMAWNQGLDLYHYGNNRVLTGFEYQARWLITTNDVPFSSWTACDGAANASIAGTADHGLRPIWEMVWNHYANRMGLTSLWTKAAADSIRPENAMALPQTADHPGFGTLLFSLPARAAGLPPTPVGLAATPGNGQVALNWTASAGATSYNVKRATARAGPFVTLTNLVATSFTDATASNGVTYFYAVSAVNGSGETINSGQAKAMPTDIVPTPPTGLTATAVSASRIELAWTNSPGASSYTVKRATVDGGPYAAISSGVTFTSFGNTGLAAGTPYFYVVSATNHIGQSANSTQASATTFPALPAPWLDRDIGAVGATGSGVYSNGVFTVKGAGQDIGADNQDRFHFTYFSLTGDGTLTARLTSEAQGHTIDKVGLMMRETTNANARTAQILREARPGPFTNRFSYRSSTGGSTTGVNGPAANTLPQWYRLVRTGNKITGFSSANGMTWTPVGSNTFTSLSNTLLAGFAVCSRHTGSLNTSVFDNVTTPSGPVAPPAAPTNLTATAGHRQVALSWSAVAGATGYHVKRSTTNGGPHATVAGVASAAFTDTGLSDGTTYYYVVSATNAFGESANSAQAGATPLSAFQVWATNFFGCHDCPQADPASDADGDGLGNFEEFLAGTNPTNSGSAFRILSVRVETDDINVEWQTAGGRTNVVQSVSGEYSAGFTDVSGPVVIAGAGDVATNFTDAGRATNGAARFYRIRLAP
jgi:fibronectin type 3 domain-containing protein